MNCVRYPIAAALGLLVLPGCGNKNPYDLYPVSGEVTYNGKPLVEGSVVYLPAEPGGRQATGPIQPDGKFQLTTHQKNDGAVKGKYNIVVYAYEAHPGEPTSREEQEAMAQRGGIKRGFLIPDRYVDPDTSGLTDTVDENHGGFKKIELTDGGPAAGN